MLVFPDGFHGDILTDDAFHEMLQMQSGFLTPAIPKPVVILKCAEGEFNSDPTYLSRYNRAHDTGFATGSYCFIDKNNPSQDIPHYLRLAHLQSGDLFPIIDMEVNGIGKLALLNLVNQIKDNGFEKAIVYTYMSFWTDILQCYSDMPIWIADYSLSTNAVISKMRSLSPNIDIFAHQYSQNAKYPGFANACDVNNLVGNLGDYLIK